MSPVQPQMIKSPATLLQFVVPARVSPAAPAGPGPGPAPAAAFGTEPGFSLWGISRGCNDVTIQGFRFFALFLYLQ